MPSIRLEKQEAESIDEATKAAVEIGREQLRSGETVTLEQSDVNLKKRIEAWRKDQKEVEIA